LAFAWACNGVHRVWRNVCGLRKPTRANSIRHATSLIYKCANCAEWRTGRTMRLGAWTCKIEPETLATGFMANSKSATHRTLRINREYEETLTAGGSVFRIDAGWNLCGDGGVAGSSALYRCQFHPEFKSKPLEPHPYSRHRGAAYEHGLNGERESGL